MITVLLDYTLPKKPNVNGALIDHLFRVSLYHVLDEELPNKMKFYPERLRIQAPDYVIVSEINDNHFFLDIKILNTHNVEEYNYRVRRIFDDLEDISPPILCDVRLYVDGRVMVEYTTVSGE